MNINVKNIIRILRFIHYSLFFNFKFLPFKQAIKLPILLYKPKLSNNKGKYTIESPVSFGMIRLGFPTVSIYPNSGIILENKGNMIFQGKCRIGNNSAISIGERGWINIGNNFVANTTLKIVCYHKINISNDVLVGWDVLIMDTDFHSMKTITSNNRSKGYGPIIIGNNIWIASYCNIYKNTEIPGWCTVSSNTIINKKVNAQPYSVIYNPISVETKYVARYRDNDDKMWYE